MAGRGRPVSPKGDNGRYGKSAFRASLDSIIKNVKKGEDIFITEGAADPGVALISNEKYNLLNGILHSTSLRDLASAFLDGKKNNVRYEHEAIVDIVHRCAMDNYNPQSVPLVRFKQVNVNGTQLCINMPPEERITQISFDDDGIGIRGHLSAQIDYSGITIVHGKVERYVNNNTRLFSITIDNCSSIFMFDGAAVRTDIEWKLPGVDISCVNLFCATYNSSPEIAALVMRVADQAALFDVAIVNIIRFMDWSGSMKDGRGAGSLTEEGFLHIFRVTGNSVYSVDEARLREGLGLLAQEIKNIALVAEAKGDGGILFLDKMLRPVLILFFVNERWRVFRDYFYAYGNDYVVEFLEKMNEKFSYFDIAKRRQNGVVEKDV